MVNKTQRATLYLYLYFELRKKNPKMRRNVKFDDAEMDLVMDFSLDPDVMPWRKLRPAQALAAKAKLGGVDAGEVGDDELDTMLGTAVSGNGGEKSK